MVRINYWAVVVAAFAAFVMSSLYYSPAVSIKRSEHLTLDGTKLYLLTRGADWSAPVLLWLHGGPGGAERPCFAISTASSKTISSWSIGISAVQGVRLIRRRIHIA
jgi:hypothetical protein